MYLFETRIVLVDDNIDLMSILNELLSQQNGFKVVGMSADGLEAIDIITKTEPDVVILDITMPYLDGIGVLEKFRSINKYKKIQFIMLTGLESYQAAQAVSDLGANFYIVKPFYFELLVSKIKQLQLPKHQAEIRTVSHKLVPSAISENSIEFQIKSILDQIGVPSHLKGYQYLIYAITLIVKNFSAIHSIKKIVYPGIAQEFKTTQSRADQAIRGAIKLTWNKRDNEGVFTLFGYDINDEKIRPSNSDFIMMVANEFCNKSSAS